MPDRESAIRFVVGVNGSGKTHMLQAIAETFLALARQKRPHFPVTLAWELGEGDQRRTLIFQNSGQDRDAAWWQGKEILPVSADMNYWEDLILSLSAKRQGWEPLIRDGSFPGKGVGLPSTVLAFTSGCSDSWSWLFRDEPSAENVNIISQAEDYDPSNERPAGWSRQRELEYEALQKARTSPSAPQYEKLANKYSPKEEDQNTCILLDSVLLKLALLAVSLPQAMQDHRKGLGNDVKKHIFLSRINNNPDEDQGLRRLLSQIGWAWPVSIAFHIDFAPDAWSKQEAMQKSSLLQALYLLASEVVREPEPSTQRRLFIDLRAKAEFDPGTSLNQAAVEQYFGGVNAYQYAGDALLRFLGGPAGSPFDAFKFLVDLRRQGLLKDIQMAVRKADVEDILLFDELSDGEQVFLERMALFHLLEKERDALLLLDEPEVHFNDKWKREIVDIIDSVIKDRANDVLIATHSSIALTDVFNDEIILFEKQNGKAVTKSMRSTTFGADPSEVMVRYFGVPDSMGKRAMEWLDAQLERKWEPSDIPELEQLLERIGPGFHRSELRGILRRLKEDAI